MTALGVVVVDCALDRRLAGENARSLVSALDGRSRAVIVQRSGLSPIPGTPADEHGPTRGACLRIGVDRLRGNVDAVLFTDTDSRVCPGWIEAARAAFENGAALIGGPVTPPTSSSRAVDEAGVLLDYGRHLVPPYLNEEGHPSANNFGIRSDLLDASPTGDIWKSSLCAWAQQRGVAAVSVAGMQVESTKRYAVSVLLADQAGRGRLHASLRRSGMGIGERVIRIIGAPAVPAVTLARLWHHCGGRIVSGRAWVAAGAASCAWAAGEAVGYLVASGHSRKVVFG